MLKLLTTRKKFKKTQRIFYLIKTLRNNRKMKDQMMLESTDSIPLLSILPKNPCFIPQT